MKQYVVNRADLIHNIRTICDRAGHAQVIGVLKGQGYGLGLLEFAKLLQEQGVTFFAVSELEEAAALREAGFSNDILLLTATELAEELRQCVQMDVIVAAGSANGIATLDRLAAEAGKTVRVHVKVDTGFGRFGFAAEQMGQAIAAIQHATHIQAEGIFSHFSFSFSDKRKDVQIQYDKFMQCVAAFEQNGITGLTRHICNSCAFLQYPEMHLDAVRVGSAFLGRLPLTSDYGLKRIGSLHAPVIAVKRLPKGSTVGYANTYRTKRDTEIAIVPVGYKDGFGVEKSNDTFRFMDILRYVYHDVMKWGNKLSVRAHGKAANIIGRVSMYNIVLDVTGMDIHVGDDVELPANPILVSRDIPRIYQ